MVMNVLSILLLVLLAALFIFLAVRAGRARRAWIKWPGMLLAGLLGLAFVAVTAVALLGFYRLNVAPYQYTVSDVKVAMTQENIARGERLAQICTDCHSSDKTLPLSGNNLMSDPSAPPLGTLWAADLTPSGPLKDWTDGEIMRALREGVDNKGRPLLVMPSMAMHSMSDADAEAIVAYLRSQPPGNKQVPPRNLNVLAALFIGAGMFQTSAQTPITAPIVAPSTGTAEYGSYLASAVGCRDCHGPKLDGVVTGPGPGSGAPNLAAQAPGWKEEQFINVFRKGMSPSGRTLTDAMPWKSYSKALTDDELRDLYAYLKTLKQ